MKRIMILGILFLIASNLYPQSGFKSRTGITTHTLRGVYSLYMPPYPPNYGTTGFKRYVIVGDSGTVLSRNNTNLYPYLPPDTTWHIGVIDSAVNLYSVTFPFGDTGFAVGDRGALLKSNDDGLTWRYIISLAQHPLYSIAMPNIYQVSGSSVGWAAGDSGKVFRTIDRCKSWTGNKTVTKGTIRDISEIPFNNLWACGDSGVIMKSTSLGSTWSLLSTPRAVNFSAIQFLYLNAGWVVGDGGTILYSQNGGLVWSPETSKTNASLRALCMLTSGVGYVVGDSGVILKTNDNGSHWTQLESGTTKNLYGVSFVSDTEGVVVGEDGTLLETTTGGIYVPQPSFSISPMNLDFGKIIIGENKKANVTIVNNGTQDLTVLHSYSDNGDFTVSPSSATVTSDGRTTFTITYTPTSTTLTRGEILFENSTVDSLQSISVTGNGAPVTANSGWFWQNPVPPGNIVNDVRFIDDSTVVAVGERGLFMKSIDAGISWNVKQDITGKESQLNRVSFINSTTGFTTGNYGVMLKTEDGGDHWQEIESNSVNNLTSISFCDSLHASSIGSSPNGSSVINTFDGGTTWGENSSIPSSYMVDCSFMDSDSGVAVGSYGYIARTTDKGATWQLIKTGIWDNLLKVIFPTPNIGYAVGYTGTVLKTTDAGRTWNVCRSASSSSSELMSSISFRNANEGIIAGSSIYGGFACYRTTDGGNSWVQINNLSSFSPTIIFGILYRNQNIITYGIDKVPTIIRSSDDGAHWYNETKARTINSLHDIAVIDENTEIAVGDSGTMLRTTDAGATWIKPLAGTVLDGYGISLHSISYNGTQLLTVVGDYGLILQTSDGGAHWKMLPSRMTENFTGVSFSDSLNGYIVGDNGTLLQTIDGGESWKSLSGVTKNNVTSVYSFSPCSFVIGGTNGFIGKTIDNGHSWTINTINGSSSVNRISFSDEQNGLLVGSHGLIYQTTDGGMTWASKVSGTVRSLYDVQSFAGGISYAVGDSGTFLCTTDNGNSWSTIYLMAGDTLFSLGGSDKEHIVIVGSGGSILRTNSGASFASHQPPLSVLPNNFSLEQNYPNPFNPSTTIQFSLAKNEHVKLAVYDILGREIALLIDDNLQPGMHTVRWFAENIASGVYWYRLEAGSYLNVKKMVLVK